MNGLRRVAVCVGWGVGSSVLGLHIVDGVNSLMLVVLGLACILLA